jgi:hypothetical protein
MFICFHCLVIITKVSLLYVRHGQEAADEQVALINTVGAAWCHCRRVWRCCYFLQRAIWISILTTHVPLLHLQMFLSQSFENELKMETCVTIFPSSLCFPWHLNLVDVVENALNAGVRMSYLWDVTTPALCCVRTVLRRISRLRVVQSFYFTYEVTYTILTFISPCIVIYSFSKTNKCSCFSNYLFL